MADIGRMDRTWLCRVLFMDIAGYSSQSTELQMKWKQRFNGYLSEAIAEVPENERVILDTGDGAAVCFLGAPETPMFAALQLCRSFCAITGPPISALTITAGTASPRPLESGDCRFRQFIPADPAGESGHRHNMAALQRRAV